MLIIDAKIRKDQGKGASRRLRLAKKLPAIIYGGKEAPMLIELDHNILMKSQIKEKFYSDVLVIKINNKSTTVKVQTVQRHPFKPQLTHIDFVRV